MSFFFGSNRALFSFAFWPFPSLKKLRRPYELAKFVAFWSIVIIIALWTLYYISVGVYLSFYYLVLRPPSVVSLSQPLNLRYPDPDVRDYVYAYHCIAPVTYPQTYRWKLSLELPENPTNMDAGVFMVSLALYPPNKLPTQPPTEVKAMFYRHLQSNVGNPSVELEAVDSQMRVGSRPLMLRWRPAIYRVITTLVYAVPRLFSDLFGFGLFDETQVLETHLIERQITHSNATARSKQCFVVSINNPNVQIYKATIEATVLLEGWRYLLFYWFWTCLFVGSFLIFATLVFFISTYLFFKLLIGILRGEVTMPKIWLSEDEQKIKDMKRTVSSFLLEKKRQSQAQLDLSSISHSPLKLSSPALRSPRSAPLSPAVLVVKTDPTSPPKKRTQFASLDDEELVPSSDQMELQQESGSTFDDLDWRLEEQLSPRMREEPQEATFHLLGDPFGLNDPPRVNRFERILDESRIASSSGIVPESSEFEEYEDAEGEEVEIRPLLEEDSPETRQRKTDQDVDP